MSFVKESVSQKPIVDTVFTIVKKAKEDKAKSGEDVVVDATIGSLYDEEGKLVALDSVFSSLKNLDNRVLAAYAASFTGNEDFKDRVYQWVLNGNSHLHHEIIATPGGTGAVAMTIQECLDAGQTVILPEIAWGSYNLMAQMNNLQQELNLKVMDRTLVILDIFAKHASTSEGKLQVEMAQLSYRLARLSGLGKSLSRLGGGIGTRGPGEKKLETDRRLIRSRMARLRRELSDMQLHRDTARKQRLERAVPVAAIVGYTNAGKSTLLNALTGADILAQDQLFATLDPTTRRMELSSGQELLLTDTVGFIRKLPHHLVEAFQSTLEEARYADFILHVVDSASPQIDAQMETVYETLAELGVTGKPVITLFNKQDLAGDRELPKDLRASHSLRISAATGEGLPELRRLLERTIQESRVLVERVYPYAQAGDIARVRRYGQIVEEEYREDGIYIRAWLPRGASNV